MNNEKYQEMNSEKYQEMIGYRLDDCIGMLDDVVLHIGSDSCFVFVGNRETYKADIQGISKNLLKNAKRLLAKNLENMEKEIKNMDPSGKVDMLRKSARRIGSLYEWVENYRKYIQWFSPMMDRKVVDIYPRLQGDGIVIIVEGSEIGSFWTKEEYDKRHCHNKLGHVIS